jgi:hypothetical protein
MEKSLQYLINYLFGASVVLPMLAGLAKWNKMEPAYKPVIIAFVGLFFNETLRYILINLGVGLRSIASYNYFVLALMWLYTWQFARWQVLSKNTHLILGGALTVLWVADYFLIDGWEIDHSRFWFRIGFALTMVVLSIQCINSLIVQHRQSLLLNARFLFCLGFLMYYTYRIFNDAFTLRGFSHEFLKQINDLNRYLVVLQYLVFLIAVVCIPRKKNFLQLS